MGKYKIQLILPFVLMVLFTWSMLGTYDNEIADAQEKKLQEQHDLLEQASRYAEDGLYGRAAETAVKAKKLNVGNIEDINLILLKYYDSDKNRDSWADIQNERIKNETAQEEDYIGLAAYYCDTRDYKKAIKVMKEAETKFTDSSSVVAEYEKIRYMYSYKSLDYSILGSENTSIIAARSITENPEDESFGKFALINADSYDSSKFTFLNATSMVDGYAAVKLDNGIYALDKDMKYHSKCHDSSVTDVYSSDNEMLVLEYGNKYVLADLECNIIENTVYDYIGRGNRDGIRAVKNGSEWFFIDKEGKKLSDNTYHDIAVDGEHSAFCDGYGFVANESGFVLIDTSEAKISESCYTDAYPFLEKSGYAAVRDSAGWSFINQSGETKLSYNCEEAKSFSNELAAVRKGGKWGYIDKYGNMVIDPKYDDASPFYNGRAFVLIDGEYGMISLNNYQYFE